MGLKGAPSYFQQQMMSILGELLHVICEVYIDDIIVFASSEEEFVDRVRLILRRLTQHKVTINPKKCKLGLDSVEFLGMVIDKNGLSFSKEKKKAVTDFRKPKLMTELKKFLGMANYFSRHIKNYANTAAPLNRIVPGGEKYKKKAPVQWNSEAEEAYEAVKLAVANCPSLFFIDDDPNAMLFLLTDACDYGIGGYLFQLINGTEYPIAFMSKTLTPVQLRWSTIEKECYAIFCAMREFEGIVRDTKFRLRTDHRNLIFINKELRSKVQRWKLAIQHFNFDIEHIDGESNFVADILSRQCPLPNEEVGTHPNTDATELLANLSETQQKYLIETDYKDLLKQVHNTHMGHHGYVRTLSKVVDLVQHLMSNGTLSIDYLENWKSLRKDVSMFIRQCPCCQKMSYIKIPVQTHPFTRAEYYPMERVDIDTIGPLPPDDFGNSFIIVMIDAFTRFVELFSAKDTTAKVAVIALMQWCGRYGIPSEIFTDGGTQYQNDLVKELCRIMKLDHNLAHAYSKEENSIVERANKEVTRFLKQMVFSDKIANAWSKYLPMCQRILNTQVHSSIGITPTDLLFGKAVNLDRNILFEADKFSDSKKTSLSEHMAEMLETQAHLLSVAYKQQEATDRCHFEKASQIGINSKEKGQRVPIMDFPVNSFVLVQYENEGHRPPSKLHTQLRGPLQVKERVWDEGKKQFTDFFLLLNLVNNKLEQFHIKNMRPFLYDEAMTNPVEVALADTQAWIVDKIVDHKGKLHPTTPKANLSFLVKWKGFGDDANTWEPWSGLRNNEALHLYLRHLGKTSIIPTQFKHSIDNTKNAGVL